MIWWINRKVAVVFDTCFSVMASWPAWLSLLVLSAITGVLAMVVYKYTSNQAAIGRVRDAMKSSLLALKLFKDDLGTTFRSQGRLFAGAVKLFVYSLVPLVVMMIPMVPLITQAATRYEWRPFRPGERIVLEVWLRDGTPRDLPDLSLEVPDEVTVEVGPTRIYQAPANDRVEVNRVAWRLHATEPGDFRLAIHLGDDTVEKTLAVRDHPASKTRNCPVRPGTDWVDRILYPVDKPAQPGETIQRIETRLESGFAAGSTPVFGMDVHWIITFLVASILVALIFKPIFKVRL